MQTIEIIIESFKREEKNLMIKSRRYHTSRDVDDNHVDV